MLHELTFTHPDWSNLVLEKLHFSRGVRGSALTLLNTA